MRHLIVALLLLAPLSVPRAFGADTTNVILVTVDGLRWQEVFRGADQGLLQDERFTPQDFVRFQPHQKIRAGQGRAFAADAAPSLELFQR